MRARNFFICDGASLSTLTAEKIPVPIFSIATSTLRAQGEMNAMIRQIIMQTMNTQQAPMNTQQVSMNVVENVQGVLRLVDTRGSLTQSSARGNSADANTFPGPDLDNASTTKTANIFSVSVSFILSIANPYVLTSTTDVSNFLIPATIDGFLNGFLPTIVDVEIQGVIKPTQRYYKVQTTGNYLVEGEIKRTSKDVVPLIPGNLYLAIVITSSADIILGAFEPFLEITDPPTEKISAIAAKVLKAPSAAGGAEFANPGAFGIPADSLIVVKIVNLSGEEQILSGITIITRITRK